MKDGSNMPKIVGLRMRSNGENSLQGCGVYQIQNTVNGMIYIGHSRDILDRIKRHQHPCCSKIGNPMYADVAIYGWSSFFASIIEFVADESLLDERERFWIQQKESFKAGIKMRHTGDYRLLQAPKDSNKRLHMEIRSRSASVWSCV